MSNVKVTFTCQVNVLRQKQSWLGTYACNPTPLKRNPLCMVSLATSIVCTVALGHWATHDANNSSNESKYPAIFQDRIEGGLLLRKYSGHRSVPSGCDTQPLLLKLHIFWTRNWWDPLTPCILKFKPVLGSCNERRGWGLQLWKDWTKWNNKGHLCWIKLGYIYIGGITIKPFTGNVIVVANVCDLVVYSQILLLGSHPGVWIDNNSD